MLTTRTALMALLVGLSGLAAIQADETKLESSRPSQVRARRRAVATAKADKSTGPSASEKPREVRQASATSSAMQHRRKVETAIFAGGCFWCMEAVFEQLKGVSDVESGYCGGTPTTASYERVH